jgi:hypothetical protein
MKPNTGRAGWLAMLPFVLAPTTVLAEDFTAGTVLKDMTDSERYPYVAGVVEGLAYARYQKDGKATDGMGCIYDWFYERDNAITDIYAAFAEFSDFTPGAVVAALVQKECGG